MGIKTREKKYLLFQPLIILLCVFLSHKKETQMSKGIILYTIISVFDNNNFSRNKTFFRFFLPIALCGRCQLYVIFTVMILDKKLIVPKIC